MPRVKGVGVGVGVKRKAVEEKVVETFIDCLSNIFTSFTLLMLRIHVGSLFILVELLASVTAQL